MIGLHRKGGMLSSKIILNQLQTAETKFPSVIKSQPPVIEVQFDERECSHYTLLIPEAYPENPPRIMQNDEEVRIPLVENWIPAFQLFQVIEGLSILCKPYEILAFEIDGAQIAKMVDESDTRLLIDPKKRLTLIQNLPFYQQAKEVAEQTMELCEQNQKQIDILTVSVMEKADLLREKLAECDVYNTKLRAALSARPNPEVLSVEKLVETLQEKETQAGLRLEELESAFSKDEIPLDSYLTEWRNTKKEMLKSREIRRILLEGDVCKH